MHAADVATDNRQRIAYQQDWQQTQKLNATFSSPKCHV